METPLNSDTILLISDKPIIAEEFISRMPWDGCGALITFTGKVRGYSAGRRVLSLEHAPDNYGAEKMLQQIAEEMRRRWELGSIGFNYRTGPVGAGEITLVIAVAAFHRQEAFAACQYAIDQFKQHVSAKEIREDG